MQKSLSILVLLFVFLASSGAIVLTFDNISGVAQNSYGDVGTYQGFIFTSNLDWIDTVGSGWNYGSVSGEFTMLNNNGGSGIITASNGGDFTFAGLYARIWGTGSRSGLNIEGYNNGSLVWTSSSLSINESWQYFSGSGTVIDQLNLNFGNHFLVDNLNLNGSVATPAISANNLNFGNVRVGTSVSQNLTVTNTGTSGSTLTGTIYAAAGDFSPTSGTQTFSLGSSQTSSRSFTYTPTSRGSDSYNVSITSNASNITSNLSGTGVSPVFSSSVTPNSTIDFGTVEYSSNQTLAVQNLTPDANLGNLTDLTILSATISGADASCFALTNFTPGTVLHKNDLTNLGLTFTNIGHTEGLRNATLTIVTDQNAALGQAGATFTYNLTAQAIPEPTSIVILGIGMVAICWKRKGLKI